MSYLSYQQDDENNCYNAVKNKKNCGQQFFWQEYSQMKDKGEPFGGLCYLLYRCVSQDSYNLGSIPLEETLLVMDMLDFMLDLRKR